MKNNETVHFIMNYLESWKNAMSQAEVSLYKEGKDNAGMKWTEFHMKFILYPLVRMLNKDDDCDFCKDAEKNCPEPCQWVLWSREYYKVDFLLYHYKDKERYPYYWNLQYAIEHENDHFRFNEGKVEKAGWLEEFVKLLPLKCVKGRVIISYDDFSSNEKTGLPAKAEYLMKLLQDDTVKESTEGSSPIIVILAPSNTYITRKKNEEVFFRFLVFNFENGIWNLTEDREIREELEKNENFVELKKNICNIFEKIKSK